MVPYRFNRVDLPRLWVCIIIYLLSSATRPYLAAGQGDDPPLNATPLYDLNHVENLPVDQMQFHKRSAEIAGDILKRYPPKDHIFINFGVATTGIGTFLQELTPHPENMFHVTVEQLNVDLLEFSSVDDPRLRAFFDAFIPPASIRGTKPIVINRIMFASMTLGDFLPKLVEYCRSKSITNPIILNTYAPDAKVSNLLIDSLNLHGIRSAIQDVHIEIDPDYVKSINRRQMMKKPQATDLIYYSPRKPFRLRDYPASEYPKLMQEPNPAWQTYRRFAQLYLRKPDVKTSTCRAFFEIMNQ